MGDIPQTTNVFIATKMHYNFVFNNLINVLILLVIVLLSPLVTLSCKLRKRGREQKERGDHEVRSRECNCNAFT